MSKAREIKGKFHIKMRILPLLPLYLPLDIELLQQERHILDPILIFLF